MKSFLLTLVLCGMLFSKNAIAFLPLKEGQEYIFKFQTETISDDKGMNFQDVLSMDMHMRNDSEGIACRMTNIKTPKQMKVTEEQLKQFEQPFKVLVKDGKFNGFATTDQSPTGPIFRRAPVILLFNNVEKYVKYLDDDVSNGYEDVVLPLGNCKAAIQKVVTDDVVTVSAEATKPDCFLDPKLTKKMEGKSFADIMADDSASSEITTFDKDKKSVQKIEQIMNTKIDTGKMKGSWYKSTYLYLKNVEPVADSMKLPKGLKTFTKADLDKLFGMLNTM